MALGEIGDLIIHIKADLEGLTQPFAKAGQEIQGLFKILSDESVGAKSKLDAFASTATVVGAGLTAGITTPIVGLITVSGEAAEKEELMRERLNAFTGDVEKSNKILQAAHAIALSSPFSFPELEGTAQKLLQLGFTADEIPGMLQKIADAAAGAGTGAAGLQDIASTLGMMETTGSANIRQLRSLAQDGLPIYDALAKKLGVTNDEVKNMLNNQLDVEKANEKIDAEQGVMFDLQYKIQKTKEDILEVTQQLNAEDDPAKKEKLNDKLQDLNHTLEDQERKLDDSTKKVAEWNQIATQGTVTAKDVIDAALEEMGTKYDGFAKKQAETTTGGQTNKAKEELNEAMIELGDTTAPVLLQIVKLAIPLVEGIKSLVEWFNKLPPAGKGIIEVIVGIAAVAGPLITGLGLLAGAISQIMGLMETAGTALEGITAAFEGAGVAEGALDVGLGGLGSTLGALAIPVAALIAIIGIVILAFKNLWDDSAAFRKAMTDAWDSIGKKISEVWKSIEPALKELTDNLGWIFGGVQKIGTQAIPLLSPIVDFISAGLAPEFIFLANVVTTAINIIIDVVGGLAEIVIGIFNTILGFIRGVFTGDWSHCMEGIREIGEGAFKMLVGPVIDILNGLIKTIQDLFNVGMEGACEPVRAMVNNVLGYVQGAVNGAIDSINGLIRSINSIPGVHIGELGHVTITYTSQDTNQNKGGSSGSSGGSGSSGSSGGGSSGGGGHACFVAGTLIEMYDGTRRKIERVRPGDVVMSIEGAMTGRWLPGKVTSVTAELSMRQYHITLDDGSMVQATGEHPFLCERTARPERTWVFYIRAKHIIPGDHLWTTSGLHKVTNHVEIEEQHVVYNFNVEPYHTYIANGFYVHNRKDERARGGPVEKDVPYIVGEEGRELFVPTQGGAIIPHAVTETIMKGVSGFTALFQGIMGEPRMQAETARSLGEVRTLERSTATETATETGVASPVSVWANLAAPVMPGGKSPGVVARQPVELVLMVGVRELARLMLPDIMELQGRRVRIGLQGR